MSEVVVQLQGRLKWWARAILHIAALFVRASVWIARKGLIVTVAILTACPPVKPPHPDADAARAPTSENACANLAAIGCIVGANPKCVTAIDVALDAGGIPIDLPCIVGADSKEAARKCAGVGACP